MTDRNKPYRHSRSVSDNAARLMSILATTASSDPTTKGLSVLVADDLPDGQAQLKRWLIELGYSVSCVSCGDDAIRIIKQRPIDLVITEVIMANGDGLEVILELKRRQPNARVIAISAGGRYLSAADCLRVAKGLGAHEVLLKPVRRDDFLAAVERQLGFVALAVQA